MKINLEFDCNDYMYIERGNDVNNIEEFTQELSKNNYTLETNSAGWLYIVDEKREYCYECNNYGYDNIADVINEGNANFAKYEYNECFEEED